MVTDSAANRTEVSLAVDILDKIPVESWGVTPEEKRKNWTAARNAIAGGFAAYREKLTNLPPASSDFAEATAVKLAVAIEKDLNDRRGYHLDVLDADIRRSIRNEWHRLINPIIAGALVAVRAERDAEWSGPAKRLSGAIVPFADGCAFQIGHTSCPMGTATVEELAELRNADNALNALIEEVK